MRSGRDDEIPNVGGLFSYPLARTLVRWAEEAGWELVERRGNWWIYTLNFKKAG